MDYILADASLTEQKHVWQMQIFFGFEPKKSLTKRKSIKKKKSFKR
jgi:hypothetical protein